MQFPSMRRFAVIACLAALMPLTAGATEHNPVAREPLQTDTIRLDVIIKLRKNAAGAGLAKLSNGTDRAAALASRTGLKLTLKREISDSMLASSIEDTRTGAANVLDALRADPAVEYAVPDRRRYAAGHHAQRPAVRRPVVSQEHRGLGGERHRRLGYANSAPRAS